MPIEDRIHEILRRNLAREQRYGHYRAWIQLGEVQNEEWGKDLPVEHIQAAVEAALARPKWYRLDVVTSDEHGIIGWEYTDEEGARRTWERSGY